MVARVILIILFCSGVVHGFGQAKKGKQKKTDVLFTLRGQPVFSNEFIYLYNKNHQTKPDEYSTDDIVSYLDLFINFKLKVAEAKNRGMDTTAAFQNEYNTYRGELIKPYLPDNRIIDSLTLLTYQRLKQEVRASHILIGLKPGALPDDTLKAYNKISELKERALAGDDFGSLAATYSEDPSAPTNKGDLGYFTALQMVYPFETVAYQTSTGEIAGPVRTQFGYHLIKVQDRIPARGEVEVAHIMIRTANGDKEKAKSLIFDLYDQLRAGASWEELCRQYSEDQGSKENGGKLRPFGSGAMSAVPPFEQIAFSIKTPGDVSDPFETAYGWHIMKLIRKIPLPSYDQIKDQLRNRVARDERVQISREAWQAKLKAEFGFTENQKIKSEVIASGDSSLNTAKWNSKKLEHKYTAILFTLKGKGYETKRFAEFVQKNQRASKDNPQVIMEKLYNQYVEEILTDLLEEKISDENVEFAMLSREYYEGILLFEIMEKEVWNKAADDSLGQINYYNGNRSKYGAGERANAIFYSHADSSFREPLRQLIHSGDSIKIVHFVKEKKIKEESGLYEKGSKTLIDKLAWRPDVYSFENNGMYYLAQISSILPPGEMTFEEARASVVADYQQALENEWIRQLRKKYPVKVNEKAKAHVLDKLEKQ